MSQLAAASIPCVPTPPFTPLASSFSPCPCAGDVTGDGARQCCKRVFTSAGWDGEQQRGAGDEHTALQCSQCTRSQAGS